MCSSMFVGKPNISIIFATQNSYGFQIINQYDLHVSLFLFLLVLPKYLFYSFFQFAGIKQNTRTCYFLA